MQFFSRRQEAAASEPTPGLFLKLKAGAAISCLLLSTLPSFALCSQAAPAQTPQQPTANGQVSAPGLPPEPAPNLTQPLFMRPGTRDFGKERGYFPNPIAPYSPTSAPPANFLNSVRLGDLIKNGKIYLSMSDAVLLALENNYDIAIQRFNLDIADTDILRARSGTSVLLGVSSGLVTGTLGSTGTTVTGGGGPGGTSAGAGGAGTGSGGQALSTNGAGPVPEQMDPVLTGTVQLERQSTAELNPLFSGSSNLTQNTNTYNFAYNQGFITGTALQVTFNNTYQTSNSEFNTYSPAYQ